MRLHFFLIFTCACQISKKKIEFIVVKMWKKQWARSSECSHCKSLQRALNLINAFKTYCRKKLWPESLDMVRSFAPQMDLGWADHFWRAVYGRSKDAASVFMNQLCLYLQSNEHTWCLSWLETVWLNYLCMLALVLKNLPDGNTGVEKMRHLFSLSIYV